MAQPLTSHWLAVKRTPRYLRGTIDFGLVLKPTSPAAPLKLHTFGDVDWAPDIDDRRSTSGACVYLGPNLISWWSNKQSLVARSSAKAEHRNLALIASKVLWIQSLLHELNISIPTPVIYCDNQSTVALSHNPVLYSRTKHMEMNIFFIREKVLSISLVASHVPTTEQIADILTKPFAKAQFCSLRDQLNVLSSSKLF